MFLEKLRWVYRILRSSSFVILTDKAAGMNIPVVSLESFNNIFVLSGQAAALQEFRDRLDELLADHETAIKELGAQERKSAKPKKARSPRGNSNTRKSR